MSLFEKVIISLTKSKMRKSFNIGEVKEISSDGLKEYRDIS